MKVPVTPSQSPFPVFVLCPPTYVDTSIRNNAWMKDMSDEEIALDKDKFTGQWYNLYSDVAANALVYLLPPKKGLQDQTYVNSFVYLPHIKDDNIIILSNFKGKGRAGEEVVANKFFKQLGYKTFKSPTYFEGWPECKWTGKDNKYYCGYGQRSVKETYKWLEKEFDVAPILLQEKDPYLYHLDCSVFVLNKDNVMMCTDIFSKKELKAVEKIANIHPVSIDAAYMGACNSLRIDNFMFNASSLEFMRVTDKYYQDEVKKNKEIEKIAAKVGLELVYQDMSEAWKSGALLSCFATPLNHTDIAY